MKKSYDPARYFSEEWSYIRKQVLEFYGNKCQRCGFKYELNVHHKHYKNWGNEQHFEDFEVLCKRCHNDEHWERSEARRLSRA